MTGILTACQRLPSFLNNAFPFAMTVRSSLNLRDLSFFLLANLLIAAFAFQTTRAAPTGRPLAEMPEPEAVRVLSPVSLSVQTPPVPAVLDDRKTSSTAISAAAMPIERDLQALQQLRAMLNHGDAETQGRVAHRVSVLAASKENEPYLRGLRPALEDLLYDYDAPEGTRLMALAALYEISPKSTLYSLRHRIDQEPSERVRTTMKHVLGSGRTHEMGPAPGIEKPEWLGRPDWFPREG